MNESNFQFNFDPYLSACLNFLILCLSNIKSSMPKGAAIHRHIWIRVAYLLNTTPAVLVSLKIHIFG